jgi:hypothetical protein
VAPDPRPNEQRPALLKRFAYAVASAAAMGVLLGVFGKPVESWALWLFATITFFVAFAMYGKVD